MRKLVLKISMMAMLALAFTSCIDDDENLSLCDQEVIISADQYLNAQSDHVTITAAEINGDCLNVDFGASGCNGDTWVLRLIDAEEVLESQPPQRNVRLVLENNEDCLAVFFKDLSFDIESLQVDGNELLLNIAGTDIQVSYTY